MKILVYTIYDRTAMIHHRPFYAVNNGVAIRSVMQAITPDSELFKSPTDFDLMVIGSYDDVTAELTPGPVERVCTMVEAKRWLLDEAELNAGEVGNGDQDTE